MKPLPDHPIFRKLPRFDTDNEGDDPTPTPTVSAAPPSRVPTRASAPTYGQHVAPPTPTTAAPMTPVPPTRIRIPYSAMHMGEVGYRSIDATAPSVTRQWTDPSRSPNGRRYFWVQR